MMAYALDPTFPEPPLATVALVAKFAKELDPKSAFLDAFANVLLDDKEGLQEKLKGQPNKEQALADYKTLSTLHTVLATIFQEQGRWYDAKPENERRTAVFQWAEVLADEREIRTRDKTYPIVPDTRVRLAEAHLKSKAAGAGPRRSRFSWRRPNCT